MYPYISFPNKCPSHVNKIKILYQTIKTKYHAFHQFGAALCEVFKYGVFSGPYFPVLSSNNKKYGPGQTSHIFAMCS